MRNRVLVVLAVFAAFGALAVGAMFQADTDPGATVMSGGAADGGGERDAAAAPLNISPVRNWFPESGVGTTCTEAVGVALLPGYGAVLTINGQVMPETELNVYENPEAPPPERVLTAAGSSGHVTWGPEEDCPNGQILRPRDNSVEACVYRLEFGPATCVRYGPWTFDAL